MTKGTMRLLDAKTGKMECRKCGAQHHASIREGGYYYRGSWQCPRGCKP